VIDYGGSYEDYLAREHAVLAAAYALGWDAVYPGLRPGSAGGTGFFGCFGFFFSRLLRC
jgi:hypothetical protein